MNVLKDVPAGYAIGLSTMGGGFKQIFFKWFSVWIKYHEGNWNDFLEWLDHQQIDEADKKAWESSTNQVDGLTYLISMLVQIATIRDPVGRKLLARALADYANPPVQIDSDKVYCMPWRVASGSYLTAHGNTRRHGSMVDYVCDEVEIHGYQFGRDGCPCAFCALVASVEGFGTRVSEEQLDYLRARFILGDDFIAINGLAVFGKMVDAIFGTTTVTEFKPMFSDPGPQEPLGAEFLKKPHVTGY